MTESAKHICHECSGRIEYPKHAFGQSVNCPHCRQETTLGEIYPSAPAARQAPKTAPPPPPPPPKASAGATASNPGYRPNTLADAKALNRVAHANSSEPVAKAQAFSGGRIGGIVSAVFLVGWLLLKLGGPVWNSYLQTDKAAISLIKESMLETWNRQPEVKKPVEILRLSLEAGPNDNRTGSAVVTLGGEAQTIPFKVKITRSFGQGLQVEWQVVEQKVDSGARQHENTAAPPQAAQSMPAPSRPSENNRLLIAEAKVADELIEQIKSTEDVVREVWNKGVKMDVEGLTQLQMIRDQIVPLVRETKSRIEQFRPSSARLQPVRTAMLDLVQHDFSAWIAVNNAAAIGNWSAARAGFDRMEVDRMAYVRRLNAATESATSK